MRVGTAFLVVAYVYVATSVYAAPADEHVHGLAHDDIALSTLLRQKTSKAFPKRGVAPSAALSGNYAPSVKQTCPSTLIRQPSAGLNGTTSSIIYEGERDWVASRRANAVSQWSSYLNNTALNFTVSGFNLASFLSNTSNLPNVAIAASGGGYRAMIHAAALVNAFDARNISAVQQGTGGILQLATYIAGLSGGSWLVGSLAVNDFPTILELRNIWNLTENLVRTLTFVLNILLTTAR
jgi:lysophospholipase